MKVVVRHPLTKFYQNVEGLWTEDLEEARDFQTTADAVTFCLNAKFDAYQILMKHHSNPTYDIVVVEHWPGAHATDERARSNKSKTPRKGSGHR